MKAVVSGLGLALVVLLGPALVRGGLSRGAADDVVFAGHGPALGTIQRALRKEKPLSAKPVGTSSVVFKLDLEGSIDAAFRPENRLNPRGHLAEIAAYRIGRALGFDHVAPAVPRSMPFSELQRMVQKDRPDAWGPLSSELNQRSGQVHGVAIYWIPEMRELGFDTRDGIARFTRWLAQDGIPASRDKSKQLAAQLSTMLGFDYLIANFDRFSGANIQGDVQGQQLYLRDHNMAFFEPLRVTHHERVLMHLKRAQRFSRSFVSALKELDAQRLSGALADPADPADFQVLSPGQLRSLMDRRSTLLSYIAALIDTYGERNVLTFP